MAALTPLLPKAKIQKRSVVVSPLLLGLQSPRKKPKFLSDFKFIKVAISNRGRCIAATRKGQRGGKTRLREVKAARGRGCERARLREGEAARGRGCERARLRGGKASRGGCGRRTLREAGFSISGLPISGSLDGSVCSCVFLNETREVLLSCARDNP